MGFLRLLPGLRCGDIVESPFKLLTALVHSRFSSDLYKPLELLLWCKLWLFAFWHSSALPPWKARLTFRASSLGQPFDR